MEQKQEQTAKDLFIAEYAKRREYMSMEASLRYLFDKYFTEAASLQQQVKELKEENERLATLNDSLEDRVDGLNTKYADAVAVAEKQHTAIKQLQEEVERLRNVLNEKTIEVRYAESWYELADISHEFGVTWMHIYDEPPSRHVDRVKWASITNIRIKALTSGKESK
jgi:hypothetical protein